MREDGEGRKAGEAGRNQVLEDSANCAKRFLKVLESHRGFPAGRDKVSTVLCWKQAGGEPGNQEKVSGRAHPVCGAPSPASLTGM